MERFSGYGYFVVVMVILMVV